MTGRNGISEFLDSIDYDHMKMVFCERMDEKSPLWNLKKHSHPYLEMIFFLTGKTSIVINRDRIDVSMFDSIVYPPGVEHREYIDLCNRNEVIAFGIYIDTNIKLTSSFKLRDRDGTFKWFFEHIYMEFKRQQVKSAELVDLYLRALFLCMERYFSNIYGERDDCAELAMNYMHENFGKDITVNKLSALGSVSTSYLNRVFTRKEGITPIRYLNNLRIKIAKELLADTTLSVEEIAWRVGYGDPCYFWRVFKKITLLPPSEYRKQILERRQR